ncbi:ORF70 [Leucania separata nucleopolyhedrovirus]|uniref:ORF70 n=1 Tax=Leucania separata nucleopolyhedrovirus TaxID=1307956 RepID=Q0IL49_NPVLS|nr:ORF70 [Leucania separata nucleopolyhedrovirus]AAR28834.1 ORF70 [Leucania separata nucleopolyhedrovirus]
MLLCTVVLINIDTKCLFDTFILFTNHSFSTGIVFVALLFVHRQRCTFAKRIVVIESIEARPFEWQFIDSVLVILLLFFLFAASARRAQILSFRIDNGDDCRIDGLLGGHDASDQLFGRVRDTFDPTMFVIVVRRRRVAGFVQIVPNDDRCRLVGHPAVVQFHVVLVDGVPGGVQGQVFVVQFGTVVFTKRVGEQAARPQRQLRVHVRILRVVVHRRHFQQS